jgi:hypothetical protein
MSKLTPSQINAIKRRRQTYGYSYQYLGDWYGVGKSTIRYHLDEKFNKEQKEYGKKRWRDRD